MFAHGLGIVFVPRVLSSEQAEPLTERCAHHHSDGDLQGDGRSLPDTISYLTNVAIYPASYKSHYVRRWYLKQLSGKPRCRRAHCFVGWLCVRTSYTTEFGVKIHQHLRSLNRTSRPTEAAVSSVRSGQGFTLRQLKSRRRGNTDVSREAEPVLVHEEPFADLVHNGTATGPGRSVRLPRLLLGPRFSA